LAYRAIIVGRAVWNANSLAVGVIGRSTWLLAIFICRAIAIIGAGGIFFGLLRLTSAADTDAAFAVIVVEAYTRGITGVCGICWIWIGSRGAALTAGTKCKDQD